MSTLSALKPDRWTAVMRGFRQRCPQCGRGALFRSYLKLRERCASCGEKLGYIRADDGPAWATILVVGHLTVPFMIVAVRADAPNWIYFGIFGPAIILLTIILLQRFKGVFTALLWSLDLDSGAPSAGPDL